MSAPMPPNRSLGECTCTFAEPRHHGETLVLPPLGGGKRGRAVYLDYIEDETEFDPACPFHGDNGTMVARIKVPR